IFDLDGVITKTADLHAKAWKHLFDEFLQRKATESNKEFIPFDAGTDYLQFVDGKPRHEGIESFLRSRGIALPFGSPKDGPEMETVCGLGVKKNRMFTEELERTGIEVYASTLELIKKLRGKGIKTAL